MFKFDIKGPFANISSPFFFFFDLPLKVRVVYWRNKQTNSVTNMAFYKHIRYCFCCYVIKSAREAANKVLLSVVWNPLLIEINLSQIRTLDIKREKVCAVCPYLLFLMWSNLNFYSKLIGRDCSVGLGAPLGEGHTEKLHFFSVSGIFSGKAESVTLLGFECTVNLQNFINFVGAIFEKIKIL